ncbi:MULTISPECIES: hypothetical protein [Galbibacter]|uniref:Uncharacterized protein n=1 Tax=Galbibacter pacificus TaxID=2996052 RepID=A0ABT6FQB6_9FLAO|nr:hypothetical protein [Galbibacter pacificus]MDG3582233.1 hypothetical protein [Galbibacter pacificus]MDG3585291.1 hypothetical protein [Galbibacter pacificus]
MNTKLKPKKSDTNKNERAKLISLGSAVAFFIAISPYLFYLYESFPLEQVWETKLYTFSTSYYSSLYMAAWNFMNKFVPLMLLIIWFFTCKHWWYHVILIPISMYVFQLVSTLNADVKYVDEFEIYYIIPVMMIVIPIVYLIRLKLFDKIVHGIDLDKIDKELKEYQQKETSSKKENKFF